MCLAKGKICMFMSCTHNVPGLFNPPIINFDNNNQSFLMIHINSNISKTMSVFLYVKHILLHVHTIKRYCSYIYSDPIKFWLMEITGI